MREQGAARARRPLRDADGVPGVRLAGRARRGRGRRRAAPAACTARRSASRRCCISPAGARWTSRAWARSSSTSWSSASLVRTPADLYKLGRADARGARAHGARSRPPTCVAGIERSARSRRCTRFIYALGIRHVGEAAAQDPGAPLRLAATRSSRPTGRALAADKEASGRRMPSAEARRAVARRAARRHRPRARGGIEQVPARAAQPRGDRAPCRGGRGRSRTRRRAERQDLRPHRHARRA